ncbi:MAG: phage tail protein [Cyanobacteria bacterium P01_G01_bin.54]
MQQVLGAPVPVAGGGDGGGVPAGTLIWFCGPEPPAGYLLCDGRAVSRVEYGALFAAIGTLYGEGDGVSTFNLPELRGEFVRGADLDRGVDTGRVLGSFQEDEFRRHTHTEKYYSATGGGNGLLSGATNNWNASQQTGATGGSETRPRNVALLPYIKAL